MVCLSWRAEIPGSGFVEGVLAIEECKTKDRPESFYHSEGRKYYRVLIFRARYFFDILEN